MWWPFPALEPLGMEGSRASVVPPVRTTPKKIPPARPADRSVSHYTQHRPHPKKIPPARPADHSGFRYNDRMRIQPCELEELNFAWCHRVYYR